jgi:hypothetical protein
MARPLPLPEVARAMGKSPDTVRRWVSAGCPTISRGGRGRGRAAVLDLDEVRRWHNVQEADKGDLLADVGRLMLEFFRRGDEPGAAGHRVLGIPAHVAAAHLAFLYEHLSVQLAGEVVKSREMETLEAVARQGLVGKIPQARAFR